MVSPEDAELLFSHNWYAAPNNHGNIYAQVRNPKNAHLHRLIMAAPSDWQVDHKSGDGLDNRRENLRLATRSQNQWNRRRGRSPSAKGVSFDRGKWKARIRVNGKQFHLGRFTTEGEAKVAYDAASQEMHGEFARAG